jgi:hypothetical protein
MAAKIKPNDWQAHPSPADEMGKEVVSILGMRYTEPKIDTLFPS